MAVVSNPFRQNGPQVGDNPFRKKPQEEDNYNAWQEMSNSFVNRLANVVGVPVDLMDKALSLVGQDEFQHQTLSDQITDNEPAPGLARSQAAVRNLAEKIGILDPKAIKDETFWTKVGSSGADTAIMLAAGFAAAPALAARTGAGVGSVIARWIGNQFIRNPGKVILSNAAAVPGAQYVADVGKDTGAVLPGAIEGARIGKAVGGLPGMAVGTVAGGGLGIIGEKTLGKEQAGEIAGGMLGGDIGASTVGKGMDIVQAPFKALGRMVAPVPSAPLRPQGALLDRPNTYAQEQVAGDVMRAEDTIKTAVDAVKRNGSVDELSSTLRTSLDRAERVSQRLADRFWGRVDKDAYIRDFKPIQATIKAMRDEAKTGSPRALPEEFISEVEDLIAKTKPVVDPETGRMLRQGKPLTVGRLLGLRSDILARSRFDRVASERGSKFSTPSVIRNYGKLEQAILDTIESGVPGNVPELQQALSFTRQMKDLFHRGPVGQILRHETTGALQTDPGDAVRKLLATYGGPEAIQRISRAFPNAKPNSVFQRLSPELEDTVRSMFRDASVGDTPEQVAKKANDFINKNMPKLQSYSQIGQELTQTQQQLQDATDRLYAIRQSAVAKYAKQNPQTAINGVFNASNPKEYARELMRTFGGDADALDGFRAGLLDRLFAKEGSTASRWKEALSDKRGLRGAFEEAFTPEQLARLDRIVNLASQIERGEGFKFSRFVGSGGVVAFRIIGAHIGRRILNSGSSGGTIQVPAITSNLGRQLGEKVFSITPSDQFLRNAVLDPKWEKLLYTRIPESIHDLKVLNKQIRRFVGATEGVKQYLLNDETKND